MYMFRVSTLKKYFNMIKDTLYALSFVLSLPCAHAMEEDIFQKEDCFTSIGSAIKRSLVWCGYWTEKKELGEYSPSLALLQDFFQGEDDRLSYRSQTVELSHGFGDLGMLHREIIGLIIHRALQAGDLAMNPISKAIQGLIEENTRSITIVESKQGKDVLKRLVFCSPRLEKLVINNRNMTEVARALLLMNIPLLPSIMGAGGIATIVVTMGLDMFYGQVLTATELDGVNWLINFLFKFISPELAGPLIGMSSAFGLGQFVLHNLVPVTMGRITDDDLVGIKKFNHLISLNLSGCNRVSDNGVKSIAQLKNLTSLNLSGVGITDRGLMHLKTLKNLVFLDLTWCLSVTESAKDDLKNALPQTEILPERGQGIWRLLSSLLLNAQRR